MADKRNFDEMPKWKQKRIQELRRKKIMLGAGIAILLAILFIGLSALRSHKDGEEETSGQSLNAQETVGNEAGENGGAENDASEPSVTESAETAAVSEATPEATPFPTQAPLADPPDRSTFALEPGVACGQDDGNGEKIVYLTLDDGPSQYTEEVLDILDRYNVKITFFVTGANPEYAYLIKEAYDRGHTIGLHTYSHDYETVYTSVDAYFQDLDAIGQIVAEQIGYVPCFIRFPGGSANYISHDYCEGIMTELTQEVQYRGYQYFDWNASSGDGGDCQDPVQLAAAATSFDHFNNIVLLSHDGSANAPTVQALPTIIEYYLSQGYTFRPIDRNTYHSHQEITN